MSHEIVKQPNGLFAVWSTIVDDFVMLDATPQDIIDDEVKDAKERITNDITKITDELNKNGYYRHFRSWKEAQQDKRRIHRNPPIVEHGKKY